MATSAYALVKMAAQSWTGTRRCWAQHERGDVHGRCTGTVGTFWAKCRKSFTQRRAGEIANLRPYGSAMVIPALDDRRQSACHVSRPAPKRQSLFKVAVRSLGDACVRWAGSVPEELIVIGTATDVKMSFARIPTLPALYLCSSQPLRETRQSFGHRPSWGRTWAANPAGCSLVDAEAGGAGEQAGAVKCHERRTPPAQAAGNDFAEHAAQRRVKHRHVPGDTWQAQAIGKTIEELALRDLPCAGQMVRLSPGCRVDWPPGWRVGNVGGKHDVERIVAAADEWTPSRRAGPGPGAESRCGRVGRKSSSGG